MSKIKNSNLYDNLKCIWMDTHVKYKLCDKDFDCDNCIFDKVMRNVKLKTVDIELGATSTIIDQKIKGIHELKYSQNIIYLKNNLILKNLFGNTYYLGISPLAFLMLDNASGFNYCKDGIPMQANYPIVQFFDDWGSYKILSPINFYCLGRLKQEIEHNSAMEWFLLLEAYPTDIEGAQLSRDEFDQQLSSVESYLKNINSEYVNIGTTMNDGGEKVKFLHNALNNDQYFDLLKLLFSQK